MIGHMWRNAFIDALGPMGYGDVIAFAVFLIENFQSQRDLGN